MPPLLNPAVSEPCCAVNPTEFAAGVLFAFRPMTRPSVNQRLAEPYCKPVVSETGADEGILAGFGPCGWNPR